MIFLRQPFLLVKNEMPALEVSYGFMNIGNSFLYDGNLYPAFYIRQAAQSKNLIKRVKNALLI
ncbi:hypothetical protein DFO77_104137 [Marinilabilia salmonicolor]|jgi:hypothetical protein|uniref:Uncharacterized protein n=1 Tax=Marinilabilia salmonicolor TaxID=989 RepID=A0A2T0XMV4_9BACT|nr:hypothetical protein BY457_10689 [Marinilabilia salmonicolor]RCW38379.1 hypothetical protein DFO77_104137 [Marinilabilia salmonicolor]